MARSGVLGPAVNGPATGYTAVYLIELLLMFLTLMTIGPLVRRADPAKPVIGSHLTGEGALMNTSTTEDAMHNMTFYGKLDIQK